MASDIILYKAGRVPVGHDQLPHLEITREIARRFNYLYGEVFPEPAALLTEMPKVLGIDGRKMSKSYGNAIFLSETAEETRKKVMSMVTDVQRPRRADPGEPDRCVAYYPEQDVPPRGDTGGNRVRLQECPDRLCRLQEDPG